jgi:hypothetical protein
MEKKDKVMMVNNKVKIVVLNSCQTVEYAAAELSKYLGIMANDEEIGSIVNDKNEKDGISLGLFKDFGISDDFLKDPELDDAIDIKVENSKGYIAGSNARSVLIGVYRFLECLGCRWLRPGKDGETIPNRDVSNLAVTLQEKASYRHRGMCIEGSVSLENMLDSVEWAPKVGLNTYMLEWENPYEYFNKWYSHYGNPFKKPEARTLRECRAYKTAVAVEIKKRGMNYHDMGHGWTAKALGLPTDLVSPWNLYFPEIPEKVQKKMDKWLAMIDGKRAVVHNSPMNSNLFYGNPEVREKIVQDMLAYCKAHPEVDFLHLWLADSWNSQCECPLCADTTPSDFMVMICNRLDDCLNQAGLKTKIVFISYVDTIWPPAKETIKNTDRFFLLFAPISRTYSQAYDPDTEGAELVPYVRNKLPHPKSVKENIGYLKQWYRYFDGDGLCFEYHFWRDCYNDPGYYDMAKILSNDIKNLEALGLNGIIEDQTQRAYFPTGFPMYLYGKTLWDKSLSFDLLAEEYFKGAYGEDWKECLDYMAEVSCLFDPVYMRREKDESAHQEAAIKLDKVPGLVQEFRKTVERNTGHENPAIALSWKYLLYHGELITLLSKALKARAEKDMKIACEYWQMTYRYAFAHEDFLQPVFDVYDFTRFVGVLFR